MRVWKIFWRVIKTGDGGEKGLWERTVWYQTPVHFPLFACSLQRKWQKRPGCAISHNRVRYSSEGHAPYDTQHTHIQSFNSKAPETFMGATLVPRVFISVPLDIFLYTIDSIHHIVSLWSCAIQNLFVIWNEYHFVLILLLMVPYLTLNWLLFPGALWLDFWLGLEEAKHPGTESSRHGNTYSPRGSTPYRAMSCLTSERDGMGSMSACLRLVPR